MKKYLLFLGMILLVLVTSCSKDNYIIDNPENNEKLEDASQNINLLQRDDQVENTCESYKYISKIIEKPEDIPYITSMSMLSNDTFRICIYNSKAEEIKVWESTNNGMTWELSDTGNTMIKNISALNAFKFSDKDILYTWDFDSGAVNIQGKEIFVCQEPNILIDVALSRDILTVLTQNSSGHNQIFQINIQSEEKKEIYSDSLSGEMLGMSCITTDESGQKIYLAGNNIIEYDIKADKVTMIMDDSDLKQIKSDVTKTITDIAVKKDSNLFIKIRELESQSDKLYFISKEKKIEEDNNELYIYSLKENIKLRQIIALYKEKNPEIEIKYEVGYTGKDGIMISDAIRSLNTSILADNGPDIIMLDELPVNQYIEKGILEDISEIIENNRENLFDNIIYKFNKEDKIYAVPTTFSIPIIVGNRDIVQAKDTNELIGKMKALSKENKIISIISPENFPVATINLWTTSNILDGNVNYKELKKFFENLKELFDMTMSDFSTKQLNENYSLENAIRLYPQLYTDVALSIYFDEAQVGITMLNNADTFAEIVSLCKEKDIFYGNLNSESGNFFFASNIFGINTKSTKKNIAKSFINYYLMEGMKSVDTTEFSVNKLVFEDHMPVSNNGEIYNTYYKTQNFDEGLKVHSFTPEELKRIENFISSLDKAVENDCLVNEYVISQTEKYLYEGRKLNTVINDVNEKLDLYLKE